MIRERESGTIEQLLMLPASTTEIVIAKIVPLFAMLCFMIVVSVALMKFAFGVPFQGSLALVSGGAALCLLAGIGVGTVIASFCTSARQALLTGFFMNPLIFSLSGALNPVEGMPKWMQPLTVFNPIYHFATIARGCLIKGSGLVDLWPNFAGLVILTLVLVSVSIWRFRSRFVLAGATLIFTMIGLRYITDPVRASAETGVTLGSALAATTTRVGSGAFPLGFAIFISICLFSKRRLFAGVGLISVVITTAIVVRIVGLIADGPAPESTRLFIPEGVMFALSLTAIALERASPKDAA